MYALLRPATLSGRIQHAAAWSVCPRIRGGTAGEIGLGPELPVRRHGKDGVRDYEASVQGMG